MDLEKDVIPLVRWHEDKWELGMLPYVQLPEIAMRCLAQQGGVRRAAFAQMIREYPDTFHHLTLPWSDPQAATRPEVLEALALLGYRVDDPSSEPLPPSGVESGEASAEDQAAATEWLRVDSERLEHLSRVWDRKAERQERQRED